MARRRPGGQLKRRTREHVIGDLGVNHAERQALLCGYSVERVVHDYGIDLLLFTYNHAGEVEIGEVLMQIKAREQAPVRASNNTVAVRVERADVIRWLSELMPVALVLYDARQELAYWCYVQAHFAARPGFNRFTLGETVTISIPAGNVLGPAAVRRFAVFRDRVKAQMPGVIDHHE